MSSTYIGYVDESGDEGFSFQSGSSRWFVLSSVIMRKSEESETVKLVDMVRGRINEERQPNHRMPPRKPLHFRDLKHEQRKYFASEIGEASLRIIVVMIDKSRLTSPENFQNENRLYHYVTRLLVERISWYCRDNKRLTDAGDGKIDIVFSNRASLDYDAMKQYLNYLEANRVALAYHATPNIIDPNRISTLTSGKRMGLQLADAVASSFYYAVEPSIYGFTEDSYAKYLYKTAYRHKEQVWGYGIKLMPGEAEEARKRGELFAGWE